MAREPLFLDVRSNPRTLGSADMGLRQETRDLRAPLQSDVSKFQQSLNAPDPEVVPQVPATPLPSGPFALFGQVRAPNTSPVAPAAAHQMLQRLVQRLLVGDGLDGQRSVRISLSDEILPGVEVEVFQDAGVWVAAFLCRNTQSFDTLARVAPEMAQQYADALQADAAWRVNPDAQTPELAHVSPVHASASWAESRGRT